MISGPAISPTARRSLNRCGFLPACPDTTTLALGVLGIAIVNTHFILPLPDRWSLRTAVGSPQHLNCGCERNPPRRLASSAWQIFRPAPRRGRDDSRELQAACCRLQRPPLLQLIQPMHPGSQAIAKPRSLLAAGVVYRFPDVAGLSLDRFDLSEDLSANGLVAGLSISFAQ